MGLMSLLLFPVIPALLVTCIATNSRSGTTTRKRGLSPMGLLATFCCLRMAITAVCMFALDSADPLFAVPRLAVSTPVFLWFTLSNSLFPS